MWWDTSASWQLDGQRQSPQAEGAANLIKAKLDPSPGDSPTRGEDSPLGVPARATEASPASEVWLEPTCGNADETTRPQGFQGPSQSGCKATAPLPQRFQAPCRHLPKQAHSHVCDPIQLYTPEVP